MNRLSSTLYKPEKKVCELEDTLQKKLIRMQHRDRQRNGTLKGMLKKMQARMTNIIQHYIYSKSK